MLRSAWVLAVVLCACASEPVATPGVAEPPGETGVEAPAPDASNGAAPPADGAIRIAALNVHRLFDTVCDSGNCGPGAYEEVETPAALDARGARIAAAFESLHVDVAIVEEIETQASLDAIGAHLPSMPSRVLGETGAPASVDVGVFSAFPITLVKSHRDRVLTRPDGTTTTFSREFLEVHLDVRGAPAIVFAAHFRSKANDDPGRRLAEAQAAEDIVATAANANPGALVVLGGDLNDVPGSPPLLALEAGDALHRVSAGLPDASVGTLLFEGALQAIDHLYVATANGGLARFVAATFHVARDGGFGSGLAGSDHAGVYADFRSAP